MRKKSRKIYITFCRCSRFVNNFRGPDPGSRGYVNTNYGSGFGRPLTVLAPSGSYTVIWRHKYIENLIKYYLFLKFIEDFNIIIEYASKSRRLSNYESDRIQIFHKIMNNSTVQ
jgi:hypothetical protein